MMYSILYRKCIIILFTSMTLFSFSQCKTVKNEEVQSNTKLKIIQPKMKDVSTSKYNVDKSMKLHVTKTTKQGDPAFHFQYVVYRSDTNNVVKKGTFRGLKIEWNDATSLRLFPYVGMERKPVSENPESLLNTNQTQYSIINLN